MFNPFFWFLSLFSGIVENERKEDRREMEGSMSVPVAQIISIAGTPRLPQDVDIVPESLTIEEVAARLQETPDPVEGPVLKKSRHPRTGHLADIVTQHS